MQKKIIALAIASALTIPAVALADTGNVTVYGVANVSYDFTDNGDVVGSNGATVNRVASNATRVGVKGSEDLGDGLSAIWQIEQLVDIDSAGGTLATRNSFAGLSSKSAGTLTLGRNDAPYKTSTRKLDLFGDSVADSRSLLGQATTSFDARLANLVTYTSPDMNGFTGAIAYANTSEANTTAAMAKTRILSLSGVYDAAPFYASLAYQKQDMTATTDEKAWRLGLGYTMDAFTGNFIYEKISDNLAAGAGVDHNTYHLTGKYSFGNDAVKAAYTRLGTVDGVANTRAKHWALGYDHSMSKRTTVYALYTRMDNDSAQTMGLSGAYNGNTLAAQGAGADPSVWSFGMKHSF